MFMTNLLFKSMLKDSFEYKQILYLKPCNDQINEAKLHRCALDLCDRCAYCELGYDKLQSKEIKPEEYSQLILDKIHKSTSILNGELKIKIELL